MVKVGKKPKKQKTDCFSKRKNRKQLFCENTCFSETLLKRIFLGRFSYVETGVSTNLRSERGFIDLINIHAKFQLIMTTGTCNTGYITWNFQLVDPISGWSKSKNFFCRSHDFIALNICVISECSSIIGFQTSHSDYGRTDIWRTIVHFLWKMR